MSNFESSSPSFSIHPSMGEELGRCRFYGVEVVTLCRLEVTQRDKLIDPPWPELHTHMSYAVTPRSRCLRMRAAAVDGLGSAACF